jgi:hypothetical protein
MLEIFALAYTPESLILYITTSRVLVDYYYARVRCAYLVRYRTQCTA